MEWTYKEEEYLIQNWGKKKTQEIAEDLGRTYQSIYNKARKLGLGTNKAHKNRPWTKEEEEFLSEYWGLYSMEHIANILNRTATAIQVRAARLGLGPFLESGDYVTLNQLIVELRGSNGRSYTVQQWIDKGLPVKTKKVKGSSFKVVNLDDFWKWAEKNRIIIDFSQLEENVLGKEPEWLKDQRIADKKMATFKRTPWTEAEDQRLINLLREFRWTYREISEKLNRTEGAIKRRMLDLGLKERPVRMSNHNPWTQEEVEILIDLFNRGYRPDIMTRHINRSAQAIRGKIERMIKDGDLESRSEFRKTC